jgi:predicted PurR-regulated permease PerM
MSKEVIVVRILYVVLLTTAMLVLVSPFLIPIFFAATVALALHPLHKKLMNKGLGKRTAAGILTAFFSIVISIPLTFFIIKGTIALTTHLEKISFNEKLREQGVQEIVSDLRMEMINFVQKFSSKYEFLSFLDERKIEQYLVMVNNYLLKFFQDVATGLPTIFILLLIMILCTYSFLKHGESIRLFFQKITGFSDSRMSELVQIFISDARQVYLSNIITGGIQSLMVAVGVSLLGLGDFFLVFFVTLILSFIPVIGAAPVAFIFAVLAFLRDNHQAAIILVVLGGVTGVVDNILRPWLTTFGESKVPPIVSFVCVIGGALWLGFPGLFIGLLVGTIAYDTLPIFWEELNPKKKFFS